MKKSSFLYWLFCFIACGNTKRQVPQGYTFITDSSQDVIVDEEGNEFVWIPVTKLQRYDFGQEKYIEVSKPIDRIW